MENQEKMGGLGFNSFFDLCYQVGRNRINFMNAFCVFRDLFHQFWFCRGGSLEFTVHANIPALK